jgi:predicted  nucleic acid-binding Zn-ribbon protein
MAKILREGFREVGRKFARVRLRRQIADAGRARDSTLDALGRQAHKAEITAPDSGDLAERIVGTGRQEEALADRRTSLARQQKEHEDKRRAEDDRFDAQEQEIRQRKAPVDADLTAQRKEHARARDDLEAANRRLEAIATSRRALEAPAADQPAGGQPPKDQTTVEAQLTALGREQGEIEARLGPLGDAQRAAAAEVQKLEARARELQAEIDAVAAQRRQVLGAIDRDLAATRRALKGATAEGTSIEKQQAAHFRELGARLLASAVDAPVLSDAMAAVRSADAHRRELQTALDGLTAQSKAMSRGTMLQFTAIVAASLVLIVILSALRPAARIPEYGPSVELPRNPVKMEINAYGGDVELPGVASVRFAAGSLSGPQMVTVAATASRETAEEFRETAGLFAPGPRVPHEVRINVGAAAPTADSEVLVRLAVPQSFTRALPPSYAVGVFAQLMQDSGEEVHDGFRPLDTNDPGDGKSIDVRLNSKAFTDMRNRDLSFEAILVLGSVRVGRPRWARVDSASPAGAAVVGWWQGDRNLVQEIFRYWRHGPRTPCKPVCQAWAPPVIPLVVNPKRPYNPNNDHWGTDYRAPDGQAVFATASGRIASVSHPPVRNLSRASSAGLMTRGYGLHVIIEHCDGSRTLFAHLKVGSTDHLRVGQDVTAGQQIGEVDSTGAVKGAHLHLEYSPSGAPRKYFTVDPHQCSYQR